MPHNSNQPTQPTKETNHILRRFADWYERQPPIIAYPLVPILLIIWLAASIKNSFNRKESK